MLTNIFFFSFSMIEESCWLILSDVPAGTVIGLDTNIWKVGRNFRGIKDIPLGIHYLFYRFAHII